MVAKKTEKTVLMTDKKCWSTMMMNVVVVITAENSKKYLLYIYILYILCFMHFKYLSQSGKKFKNLNYDTVIPSMHWGRKKDCDVIC